MAVAIEILLMAPIRIGNLARLHLDRNLVRVGKHYHLVIDGSEVKNGQDLEFELPEESCRLIDLYLSEHREADPDNRYLFPGRTTGPKGIGGLRQQIERAVKDYAGLEVNPHLFRHIAAAIYLDAHSNGYEVVRTAAGAQEPRHHDGVLRWAEGRKCRTSLRQDHHLAAAGFDLGRPSMSGGPYGRGKAPGAGLHETLGLAGGRSPAVAAGSGSG